jgi:hypothetical protein
VTKEQQERKTAGMKTGMPTKTGMKTGSPLKHLHHIFLHG